MLGHIADHITTDSGEHTGGAVRAALGLVRTVNRQVNRHTYSTDQGNAVVERFAEQCLNRYAEYTYVLALNEVVEARSEVIRCVGVAGVRQTRGHLAPVVGSVSVCPGVVDAYSQTCPLVEEVAVEQACIEAEAYLVLTVGSLVEHRVQATAEVNAYVVVMSGLLSTDRDGQCRSGDD